MRAILAALITIAQRTGRFTVAEATEISNRLWLVVGFALLACAAAFFLNAGLGWKAPSLIGAIAFAIVAIYMWSKPLHLLAAIGVGVAKRIVSDATLAQEVEEVLRIYLDFVLKWTLLIVVTFLFITGTVSFKKDPGMILPILVGLGIVGLFTWAWPKLFVGTLGRRIVYGYAVIIVILSFGSLIPGAVWVKYMPFQWDPTTIGTTPTESTLYEIRKAKAAVREEAEDQVLRRILKKVRDGDPLSIEEEGFLKQKEIVAETAKVAITPACQPFSAQEVRQCVLIEGKPVVLTAENLLYPDVLEFCVVKPNGSSYDAKKLGFNTFEIRSRTGAFPIQYRLMKGPCPDKF